MNWKAASCVVGILALVALTAGAGIPGTQRQALIALYNGTNGAGWALNSGWLGAAGTECDWYGVSCGGGGTTVVWLALPMNDLVGTLPAEIGALSDLVVLDLEGNELDGPLPASLGNLIRLKRLSLNGNHLTGAIPSSLGNLVHLEELYLNGNELTGPIPPTLGNLAEVKDLYLNANQLSGAIPPELGKLKKMTWCFLDSNQLSGAIPPELGGASSLRWLHLGFNNLTGPIPKELANLTQLFRLEAEFNELSGPIPSELGRMPNLSTLDFQRNHLTGRIPWQLGLLPKIQWLSLSDNRLEGPVPEGLGNATQLVALGLTSNRLVGRLPQSLTRLTNLMDNGGLGLRYNGLWTSSPTLSAFLRSKQGGGNWAGTQTVPPTGVKVTVLSETSIRVEWTPIHYTGDGGGYRVELAPAAGGASTSHGRSAGKDVSSLEITGLTPGDYFVTVETETDPHGHQQNTVRSEPSPRVWLSTNGGSPPPPTEQVVSLIANDQGQHGSHWMTGLRITNPFPEAMTVMLQGTPHDRSAGASDPAVSRTIPPWGTLGIEDVYQMIFGAGATGKARLLIAASDSRGVGMGPPVVSTNLYNAVSGGGELQTYGAPVAPNDLAPAGTVLCDNTVKGPGERYNFDVTTGNEGATIRYTYRDSTGGDERTATLSYKPSATRQHVAAQELFGLTAFAPNSSIVAEVLSGSAAIRGTPTNNRTSDSRSQPWQVVVDPFNGGTAAGARSSTKWGSPVAQVISLIANLDGQHGSHWMSDVKITNPFHQALRVTLKGTPHDTSGSSADPVLTRELHAGETLGIEDVYGALFGGEARGKARLVAMATDLGGTVYALPVITSNIYSADGEGGEFQTYGPAVRTDRLYPAGTVLCDNTVRGPGERYNFDVLTGNAGATIRYTYRNAEGGGERTATVSYKPAATRQHVDAHKLFGLEAFAANSSIVAEIEAGSAFLRGTPTNNITNDSRSQPWQEVGR